MPSWNDNTANLPDRESAIRSELSGSAGLPAGGTAGQVLAKNSSTDGDASWASQLSAVTASLGASATAGATTITVNNQPSWIRTGQRIVIDPYSSVCESLRITGVSGSTVTLASSLVNNHSSGTLILCSINGVVNVEWWGAKGDASTTGNDVPIQAAANAAAPAINGKTPGGTVYVPRGYYLCDAQITLPVAVSLAGDPASGYNGSLASKLVPSTDFGSGKYVVACANRGNGGSIFRDISIFSPISGWTIGVAPKNMSGLGIGSGCIVQNCDIEGFYGGLSILGNHSIFEDCRFLNNYYNVYFEPDPTGTYGFGNHRFRGIQMSTAAMAACGVAGANVIDFVTWEDIDAGHAPFCFFKETYVNQPFMNMVSFRNFNAEQWNNGIIWDSNVGNVSHCTNVRFDAPGGISQPVATSLAGYDKRILNFDYCNNIDIDGLCLKSVPGDYSLLTSTFMSANAVAGNFTMRNAPTVFSLLDSSAKTFMSGTGQYTMTWKGESSAAAGGVILSIKSGGTAVSAGQLCQVVSASTCDIYSTGTPAGFAVSSGAVNQPFPVQERGQLIGVPATGTVVAGNYLKPSATAGSVQAATGFSDGPIVGVALTGGTNTTITVEVRI